MNLRLTSSTVALIVMAAPALAEVTAEQVWQSWIDYYESVGYSVEESARDKAGDTLTIRDLTVSGGPAEGEVSMSLDRVTLTETGDGKVRSVFSDRVTGMSKGTDVNGMEFEVPFTIDMPGNAMITSGAPEEMMHEFDYPTMDIALATVTVDGAETQMDIKMGIVNTTGRMRTIAGPPAKYDYSMTSDRVTLTGDMAPTEGESITLDLNLSGLEASGEMSVSGDIDINADINGALKSGMEMEGRLTSGPVTGTLDYTAADPEGNPQAGSGSYDGKGFELSFAMSQEGVSYRGSSDAFAANMSGGTLPFPIEYAAESAGFDLQFPVMVSDEPQPFKLSYLLDGLTIGDAIWEIFDATGKLPRDPASLSLDITGLLKVNADLLDPASMMPPMPMPEDAPMPGDAATDGTGDMADDMDAAMPEPITPVEVAINRVALSMLGARIDADGKLMAPEGGDLTSTPTGQLNVTYEGVNGLIDTLASMGLIPEEQLMSTRMMLAMFAKPAAEGEDKLETRLEFKEDGSVFANGQQVK
ncbi:hypothetical protein SAMN04487972_12238 [Paracoccus halophilus]|uniref:DUF2125 domain-containing protein n=1 Tax=Paracoccus halophilus TaxID=376733 RepID=A0A099EZG2_9RHOB|nr:DUF2125 domain-containing protein [Paracoccus halophilus]KGJ03371.1 hypothetical protein IT41_14490 [Paracoccus halophilus]SFA58915.1 hypothetical protein SAMN04487972_12238 [Paracoccus halophilus]